MTLLPFAGLDACFIVVFPFDVLGCFKADLHAVKRVAVLILHIEGRVVYRYICLFQKIFAGFSKIHKAPAVVDVEAFISLVCACVLQQLLEFVLIHLREYGAGHGSQSHYLRA